MTTEVSAAARHRTVEDFLASYQPPMASTWIGHGGDTLLHDALCNPDPLTRVRIAEQLLADGADAAALSSDGYTAAQLLIARASPAHADVEVPLLRVLFEAGCDVNYAHPRDGTALEQLAARFKLSDEELAPFYAVLLARGDLDLVTETTRGRSDLAVIRRWRYLRGGLVGLLEDYLRDHGYALDDETVFSLAPWSDASRILAAYHPEDLACVDPETGWPLLHLVLDNPDLEARLSVAARLLDDGADAAAATPEGLTPVHILLRRHGSRDHVREAGLLQRLFDAGADPNAVAKQVGTPLNCLGAMTNFDEASRLPLYDVLLGHPDFDPHTPISRTKTAWSALGKTRTELLRERLDERFSR